MSRRLFPAASVLSLLLCAIAALADLASYGWERSSVPWVYRATTDGKPAFIHGTIEFGRLGAAQTYDLAKHSAPIGFSWSEGPIWMRPTAATDDNYARRVMFAFGGIRVMRGQVVPPWGWKRGASNEDVPTISIPYKRFEFPIAYLILLFAVLPAVWLRRQIRESRRRSLRCCCTCGYDLRATPDRCPECGTPIMSNTGAPP